MKMFRAVALAAAIGAVAAEGLAAQPVIGFRLGVGMSKASIEDSEDELSWLTAFIGGGFIRFGAGQIALQPELMYVTKGFKSDETTTEPEGKFMQDYVEVPVLLFLGLGTGAATPYVVVGPAFAFEVKCKLEVSGEGSASADVDCDDPGFGEFAIETKKFDIGAMFGAGLAFPAGPGSVVLDGRYNLGLMNVVDDEETGGSLKHRALYFTAGYQIPLGIR